MSGLLRIPLSVFHRLELTKDFCSVDLGDEHARELVMEVEKSGNAAWLWTWLMCRLLRLFGK